MTSRVLYLGQKPIGEDAFFRFLTAGPDITVVGAVSNIEVKDKWWHSNKIYRWCRDHRIRFVSNDARNNDGIFDVIVKERVDTIISVQHPWILPAMILDAVKGRAFNLHLAKLPEYRGYNSCSHAILNGDTEYSVSLHWMIAEVDAGDIAYSATFPITEFDTAADVYHRAVAEGQDLLDQLIQDFAQRRQTPHQPIVGEPRFYARSDLNRYREVRDLSKRDDVDRKARAFFFPPYEPAFLLSRGRKIYLLPPQLMERYGD